MHMVSLSKKYAVVVFAKLNVLWSSVIYPEI
jgi:hypothetical protein